MMLLADSQQCNWTVQQQGIVVVSKFISRYQFAEALGVSVRTVDNLLAFKQLIPTRVGGRVLISADEYERFCRRKDHSTKPPDSNATSPELPNRPASRPRGGCRNQIKKKKPNSGKSDCGEQ